MMELVLPANAVNVPDFVNIRTVRLKKEAHFFPRWTQVDFQLYVLVHRRISLDFSNTCPFFAPGIEFIHDIYCALYPEDFTSKRDRLICLYSRIMYRAIAKRARIVLTVSEYTKQSIVDRYHCPADKIHVVYSGVTGYKDIQADYSVFDRLPALKDKAFYFTLGSLSRRKNLKWIAEHAALYPEELFAVSGKALSSVVAPELEKMRTLPNVIMTGYLDDGEVKALLSRCKAFVLPSYFEGFGLPPLEALSCGTQIIVSDRTSLPEIYGKAAHYIDPDKPDVNLDKLLAEPVADPSPVLEKYDLSKTAERIYNLIDRKLLH
ncbi:MAG: glycosyltransferase family 4 protein [Treponema sp.]|nr:glycosyltransferase family 4 protein [Treponema sp.]